MAEMKKIATRDSYGNALAALGAEHENLVVLDADLAGATKTATFKKAFPDRHFDCGIAEANMIGIAKRIIAFDCDGTYMVMFNPEIVKSSEPYETEEGCLSLPGTRKTKRFRKIKLRYQTTAFQTRLKTFTGWTAQIIQHEIDHCNGILI